MTTTQRTPITPVTPGTAANSAVPTARERAGRTRAPARARFTPRTRKAILLLHVISSMTWLGLDVGLLALSITGSLSDDPVTLRAAYLSMNMLGDTVLIPASLLALVTGVLLGVGTKWGLVRYTWVLTKLVLTVVTAALTVVALRASLNEAAAGVLAARPSAGDAADGLLFAPVVSLTCYTFMTVLSIYKPWGRIRRGRRAAGA
ncbi:DUF2269 family protein [Actinomadura rugatobispora]|uniref:DUF2269 family protein n=1 Tax=Actinomadura rugatobispora TaxID=1994 RepID=A0ABW1A3P6_9ACTN